MREASTKNLWRRDN